MSVEELMELYADTQAQIDLLKSDKDKAVEQILDEAGIWARVDDINHEYEQKVAQAEANMAALKATIGEAIKEKGETVKTKHIEAVYINGRVTYDPKALDALRRVYSWLNDHRKVNEPYVQIKWRKQ